MAAAIVMCIVALLEFEFSIHAYNMDRFIQTGSRMVGKDSGIKIPGIKTLALFYLYQLVL